MDRLIASEIYRWWDVFANRNGITEIRCIGSKNTASGYFNNPDDIIRELTPYANDYNIYFVINEINDGCYSREQCAHMVVKPKNTTSDSEITRRRFVLIDIDCDRPSGVCASDAEVNLAKAKANQIYKFLTEQGFYKPITVFSSSGVHLYLPCDILPCEETDNVIKRFLQSLAMMFNDEHVKVDEVVFNRARISRLPGSFSCKGSKMSTERPQRACVFVSVPTEKKVNDIIFFQKVADMLPEVERPKASNNFSTSSFDLDKFIEEHKIKVERKLVSGKWTRYILESCPFCGHPAPDSALFRGEDGAIGFKCFHNSCSQFKWNDFRIHYDPRAYDQKSVGEYAQKLRYYDTRPKERDVIKKDDDSKGKRWLSMKDIKWIDPSTLKAIPTGFTAIDRRMMGLLLGDVTVLSGLSGAGKTSLLDCLTLNVIQRGYKVAIWSGELQDYRFQSWVNQVAAGKNHVYKREGFDNIYYCPKMVSDKIAGWLDGKLFLYNNDYGNKWGNLFDDIKKIVEEQGISLLCIDNLMTTDLSEYDCDKYERQTKFINDLKEYAKKNEIHIILVAHPRKTITFLRKEDISGTADITNLCDNVIIIHRAGKDFFTRGKDFLGQNKVDEMMGYDVVLEVCKNRSNGITDFLVGLFYETETRRLKNDISENIIYGWYDSGTQVAMPSTIYNDTKTTFYEEFPKMLDTCPF